VTGELADAWPALARYPHGTALRLELWPEALPTLGASEDGGVRVDTGRVAIDVWVEDAGRWRAATIIVSMTIDGELTASPEGLVWLDPTHIEVYPAGLVDGLVAAPDDAALASVLAPLVSQVITQHPLVRLPSSARPAQYQTFEIGLDHAILLP